MREVKLIVLSVLVMLAGLVFLGCDDDGSGPAITGSNNLALQPVSLPTLKSGLIYEGWVVNIDEDSNWVEWQSFGKFFWDNHDYFFLSPSDTNRQIDSIFQIDGNAYDYDLIAITLETHPIDDSPDPSPTIVAFSPIEPDQFTRMEFPADFNDADGYYAIGTFSDGRYDRVGDTITNEYAGIWFIELDVVEDENDPDIKIENYTRGLDLPNLPDTGYSYEGWVILDSGDTLSTGKFLFADFQDYDNPYAKPGVIPNFPGEEFLTNAPEGLSFPLNLLQGGETIITIEPNPDNDLARPSNFIVLFRDLPVINNDVRSGSIRMANVAKLTFPRINVYFFGS